MSDLSDKRTSSRDLRNWKIRVSEHLQVYFSQIRDILKIILFDKNDEILEHVEVDSEHYISFD